LKAVELDPENLDARADLINFYLIAPGFMGGSVDKAREQAGEIAKRDAVRGATARANIAVDQKDPAAAERLPAEARGKHPGEPRLRNSLGLFYQTQKRWDAAFEVYEAMLAADPDAWNALYQLGRATPRPFPASVSTAPPPPCGVTSATRPPPNRRRSPTPTTGWG